MSVPQSKAAQFLAEFEAKQKGEAPSQPSLTETTQEPATKDSAEAFLESYASSQKQEMGQAEMMAQPSVTPETPPTEAGAEDTGFNINVISEGMKKGISDVAALPGYLVDAANYIMDQIPGLDMDNDPIGGSKMIRDGWQMLLNYQPQERKTTAEKYAGQISEFLGGSIVMGPGMINKMLGAQTTWIEMKRVAAVEAATSVGGGAMSQFQGDLFANAYGEQYRYLGELFGGMSGAQITVMAPSILKKLGLAVDPIKKLLSIRGIDDIRALSNDWTGAYSRKRAHNKIVAAVGDSPSTSKNIDRAVELTDEIKDFKPNPSQASASPGMAQLQEQIDSKSLENVNRAMKQELANTDAIYAYYRRNFPEAKANDFNPQKIFRKTRRAIKTKLEGIEKQQETLAESYGRKPIEEGGKYLREKTYARKKEVKALKDAAYDELYRVADEMGVVDDISDIRKLVDDVIREDQYYFDQFPSVYKKIQALISEGVESATGRIELPPGVTSKPTANIGSFRKIHSLYRDISREYNLADRAGDGGKMYHLAGIKDMLDNKLAKFTDDVYGDFASHKKAVDTFYREEYAKVFKEGMGAKILGVGKYEQTPEGLIVRNHVLKSGDSSGLDKFNKIFGNDPEAQKFLRNGILDEFSRQTVKRGKLSEESIDTFMRNYNEVLTKMPSIKAMFSHTETMVGEMAKRSGKLLARRKGFSKTEASRYAKIAGFPDLKSAAGYAIKQKEPKDMRILMRSMKTPEAREGLATIIADHVMDQSNPWQFLLDNEERLKPVFNQLKPGHYNNLKNVAEAMNILSRHSAVLRVRPGQANLDQLQEMIGTSIPSAFAQVRWAVLYGKTSVEYVAVDIGSKWLHKLQLTSTERLIEEALYDPDLSKLLADVTKVREIDLPPHMASRLGQFAIEKGIKPFIPRALKSAGIAYDLEQQPDTP